MSCKAERGRAFDVLFGILLSKRNLPAARPPFGWTWPSTPLGVLGAGRGQPDMVEALLGVGRGVDVRVGRRVEACGGVWRCVWRCVCSSGWFSDPPLPPGWAGLKSILDSNRSSRDAGRASRRLHRCIPASMRLIGVASIVSPPRLRLDKGLAAGGQPSGLMLRLRLMLRLDDQSPNPSLALSPVSLPLRLHSVVVPSHRASPLSANGVHTSIQSRQEPRISLLSSRAPSWPSSVKEPLEAARA